ncbi:Na/Pi cotransporter family protein [Salisediminibacterium halotolerans]|uniref:Na/Pi cotransporter family protein n=1 Tax=Salisediminibacterium halotolerans TaxID=517425 RepID=UPI000EACD4D9|nr:Na/Pi cotransporter family protein [Salisediminibacterium halotolerans]RLJ72340.1 phosphate:Na+ symporter [Actinophytocola xinjiangensis]RPE85554.1 phosphate:Na+ symporter [Salisediminibacterium halotolerans]TWG33509.1 phosphate:Na+ symporter [Salisediminibacterium halotolerans]GEL08520.1 Na/Pi cotransporter II-like protein [Salisediminibacterium halotolerans]
MSVLLSFIGGIGIFLYGMYLLSRGMQRVAATKMKEYISGITDNRFKGFFVGMISTFMMQSSAATSVIAVGLVGSSVIALWQALGIVMGSAVGTTFTVQLLALDITEYSTIFIFIGVILTVFVKKEKARSVGSAFVGFGFIFFGIKTMSDALEPLSESDAFLQFFSSLQELPLVLIAISWLLTVATHSSATVIVIGMSLAATGALTAAGILPLLLGANIGSTFPALISSLASSKEGKKVAFSYFIFKFSGALLLLPLIYVLPDYFHVIPGTIERQIANVHTSFNLIVAALFLPFVISFAAMINRLFPEEEALEEEEGIHFDQSLADYPEEAIDQMSIEVKKIADTVYNDMIGWLPALFYYTEDARNHVIDTEKRIDRAYKDIQNFLLKVGQQDLSEKQSDREIRLLYVLNDLEHIGDIVKNVADSLDKKKSQGVVLNDDDRPYILNLYEEVSKSMLTAFESFKEKDNEKAKQVIDNHTAFIQMEKDLRFEYFNNRIAREETENVHNDPYVDLLTNLLRIHQHGVNISQTMLGIV